ncbi:MarR family winged helix-turn-helix transcriptional regulator [Metabacillus sediminilitoris]|uniref:MarR family transcriptional regulator n=1 Tax=Metabacillus sediminilitoris TaxID=2567941 RepID=A0A4V6RXH9_9BACI|nr:MarR family transcriptional regulator [Metabacillus sediminilitoris]QGQ48431.1 MarR family transcriptional regulator [Metabacillus sediminilitoris]THF76327.1 MarR family transcriptional regulator [Metabacillus sediminilitoris]
MENTSKLFHMLYQKTRLMTKEQNDHIQKHGLYSSQWSILFCLKINGPMTQSDIWRYLSVEAPTITRTIVKLEDSGWVKRTQGSDKRERLVSLTDKAIENFPSIELDVRAFEQKMLASLSKEEQENLFHLLTKLGTPNK